MMIQIVTIIIILLLAMIVSGNNLSASVGTILGSRIVNNWVGLLIGAGGFSSGLMIEGGFLANSIYRIMPADSTFILLNVSISFVIFIFATYYRIPLSLTMAIVGVAIGISLRTGYSMDTLYTVTVLTAWILAPILSIALSYYMNMRMNKIKVNNVWKVTGTYKILLIIISFLTAFALGANTFGLLYSLAPHSYLMLAIMVFFIFIGSTFLSGGVIKRVSQDVYSMRYLNAFVSLFVSSVLVEGATFFSIPLSNTQTLTSSVFGSGLSYRTKLMFPKAFLVVVLMWIASPLIGMAAGFIIA